MRASAFSLPSSRPPLVSHARPALKLAAGQRDTTAIGGKDVHPGGDQFVTTMGRRLPYQDSHPAAMGGGGIERRLCSHPGGRPPTLLVLRVWLFTEEAKGSLVKRGERHTM
jgi:hypothetical protein